MKPASYYVALVFWIILIAAILGNFELFRWLLNGSGILGNGLKALKGEL